MIGHKHIMKFAAGVMVIAVVLCLCAILFSGQIVEAAGSAALAMEYESELFGADEVIQVNIIMDEEEWQKMLDSAVEEAYYQCDVEINGERFYRVGIRPKGNTSLTSIANDPETDRYSLKLEFDQYVDGQTCYGLDKLILNNNHADATNRKEALVYDMYQYLGADASLYNYAQISVNGEYWGIYLALEAVEDSFLLRNYGTENGKLYKPESLDMGNPGGGFAGGASEGADGADLNYTDDSLESYSAIWDGAVTKSGSADHRRVVEALRHISEGSKLEQYADVDNLLKYMAVHVFSVNEDSLSGRMAHNYYLYESGGRLNLLPWDYNLAFGGMDGGSATGVVNSAIDEAFSGTEFFDALMENEDYRAQYYSYLKKLADEYVDGGGFERFCSRADSQMDVLAEKDPTAFYTYEEYQAAVEMLSEVVGLRAASIRGQLEGTIPSTESAQRDSDALIDASGLDITVMGTMGMGGSRENGMQQTASADGEALGNPQFGGGAPGEAGMSQPDGQTVEAMAPAQPAMGGPGNAKGGMPDNRVFEERDGSSVVGNLVLYSITLIVLIVSFLFVRLYRRKPRR